MPGQAPGFCRILSNLQEQLQSKSPYSFPKPLYKFTYTNIPDPLNAGLGPVRGHLLYFWKWERRRHTRNRTLSSLYAAVPAVDKSLPHQPASKMRVQRFAICKDIVFSILQGLGRKDWQPGRQVSKSYEKLPNHQKGLRPKVQSHEMWLPITPRSF